MNIDRVPYVPKRLLTSEHLLDEASEFANTLGAGRWKYDRLKQVGLTRKVIESNGQEYEVGEQYGKAIFDEITISFSALKRYVDTEKGPVAVSTYEIISTTAQDITKEEIPSNILEEIIEDSKDNEHMLYVEPEESDDVYDSGELAANVINLLDDYEIQRNQEMVYTIDEDGELDDYTLRYFYSLNGESVHEMDYTHSDNQLSWSPIHLADGSINERKPFVLPLLNEANLESEAKGLDASLEEFLTFQDLRELTEFSALPKEEHIRRILGMIGMVSSGIADRPTKPLSRLRGWYNNTYDYLLHRWERKP